MGRLVPLPSDPSCYIDLDSIVSWKMTNDGPNGLIVFSTSAGEGVLRLAIARRWSLVLEVASGASFVWDAYDAPQAAHQEMTRLAQWVWRRMTGGDHAGHPGKGRTEPG